VLSSKTPGPAHLVLFDIDGTLLVSHGAGGRAFVRAGRAVCGQAFSIDGITIAGNLDAVIFRTAARAMGLSEPESVHEAFRERYLIELEAELAQAPSATVLLPGVSALLDRLTTFEAVSVGLLTGNYERAVPLKLRAAGLPLAYFSGGAFGDHADERHALLPLALDRYEATLGHRFDARDVTIVGDTPRDVECALRNGCRCLAVATGMYSERELAAAGANRVVPDLSDPEPLLSWLPQLPRPG
jgi:phosphoglycolate phosphatase-like HAD superfamily hydrolase